MINVLLDIENTIIESLDNPRFMVENIEKIKKFIHSNADELATFTIFSFAWHDMNDVDQNLLKQFEEIFGIHLNVFPKNDLMPIFKKHFRIADEMDFHDICNSKEIGFMMMLKEFANNPSIIPTIFKTDSFKEGERFIDFTLIDDKATNSNMIFKGNRIISFGRSILPENIGKWDHHLWK